MNGPFFGSSREVLTDEQVAKRLAGTEHRLTDENSILSALVDTGVRPWMWDGHKTEVAKRALQIRKQCERVKA